MQPSFRRRWAGRRLYFFCAGIFVVQVSEWRTDSVRVRPWRARGKSIVIRCMGMKIQSFRRMHGARGMALAVGDRRDRCEGEEQIAMKRQHGPARLHRL
jgi:hypothetical protein